MTLLLPQYEFMGTGKAPRNLEDWKGMRVRALGGLGDAMKLLGEVLTKVPVIYVERDRATPQILWENGIEELSRALANPVFREAFLDKPLPDKVEGFRTALAPLRPKHTSI